MTASDTAVTGGSAVDLAAAIATGKLTSRELVTALLTVIEQRNGEINAVTEVLADTALAAAARADAAVARHEALGPLHGVPFTIKANIDVAGTATTWGIPALAGAIAEQDAPSVERLRAAGAIPLGHTNMPDLAIRHHTASSLHGRTVNPRIPDRTPGGSSGGEAAALAAGMSPLGLGNDLGGSLRGPAHCCGVTALRPTVGVVPDAATTVPDVANLAVQLMNVQGPMARTVDDLQLALRVLAGSHPRDPWSVPVPTWDAPSTGRVGVLADGVGPPLEPTVRSALRAAADRLCALGFVVDEVEPPHWDDAIRGWQDLTRTAFFAEEDLLRAVLGPEALMFAETTRGQVLTGTELLALLADRTRWGRAWATACAGHDVVLAPVWTSPAFPVGWDLTHPEEVLDMVSPVLPASFLGLPAATVPCPALGAPTQGVQIIGKRFAEHHCLDVARVLQGGG